MSKKSFKTVYLHDLSDEVVPHVLEVAEILGLLYGGQKVVVRVGKFPASGSQEAVVFLKEFTDMSTFLYMDRDIKLVKLCHEIKSPS